MYFFFKLVFIEGIWEWRKMAKSALFAALFHCAVLGCRYLHIPLESLNSVLHDSEMCVVFLKYYFYVKVHVLLIIKKKDVNKQK